MKLLLTVALLVSAGGAGAQWWWRTGPAARSPFPTKLAVTGLKRSIGLPDVPTLVEAGGPATRSTPGAA